MKPHFFIRKSAWVALLALLFAPTSPSTADTGDLSKVEIAKLGKASTALVELRDKKAYGSAFCIHSSGLFITTAHGIPAQGGSVTLVMNSGLKTQKVFKAKVVRRDGELDLALLRVEWSVLTTWLHPSAKNLPALTLGSVEDLQELMELVAFGYPFGKDIAAKQGQYPAISVNAGSVTSLRRKEGELVRIQLDASLNPGNSGGPALDRKGEVVGVVVGGVGNSGVNFAIPVSHVSQFVAKPDIQFTPPSFNRANMHKPVEFRARAVSLLPSAKPLALKLILSTPKGEQRKHKMELADGAYRVTAVPIPAPKGPLVVRLDVKYADGSLSGPVIDQGFKIGEKTVKLSEVRSLRFQPKPQGVLYDGKILKGEVSGLTVVPVQIGGESQPLNLATAVEVKVDAPGVIDSFSCTIVASRSGKEVGRLSQTLTDTGAAKLGFIKPRRSASPTTYLRAVSSKGDYIGQGKTYSYSGDKLVVRRTDRGVQIRVDGWTLLFGAPKGQFLEVGEYDDAKRYPFSDNHPGIEFYGQGRGANIISGKFVVWEFEVRGNQIVRLAIDFTQHCEETQPPLEGSIRINSSFE